MKIFLPGIEIVRKKCYLFTNTYVAYIMLRNNYRVLYYKSIVFLQYRGLSPRLWTSSGRTLSLSCTAGHDQQLQGQDLKKPPPLSLQNTVQWFTHTSFRKIFWGHTGTKASDDLKWNTNHASHPLLSISSIHSGPAYPHSLSLQPPQPPPCS